MIAGRSNTAALKFHALFVLSALLLMACAGPPGNVEPISPFNIDRYAGKWYEIKRLDHRFERGLTNVTATYTQLEDGSIRVINRGYDPSACEWKVAKGRATFQDSENIASLSVTFFWPFSGGYHVIALDQDSYHWAMVAGPTHSYLWILAREPDLPDEIVDSLVSEAADMGFNVDGLIKVDHNPPECGPGN